MSKRRKNVPVRAGVDLLESRRLLNAATINLRNASVIEIPSTGTWGRPIDVAFRVAVDGTGSAPAFAAAIVMSSDSNIDPRTDRVLFSSNFVAGLAAGSTTRRVETVTLPASAPAGFAGSGPVFIGIALDPSNAAAETNETDNNMRLFSRPITLSGSTTAPTNNLRVAAPITTDRSSYRWGELVTLSLRIANDGPATVRTTFSLFASADTGITTADARVYAEAEAFTIAPASTTTRTVSFRLPAAPPAGLGGLSAVYLGAILDEPNAVAETNEGDNATRSFSRAVTVGSGIALANLTPAATAFGGTNVPLEWGGRSTVSVNLLNTGTAPAGNVPVLLELIGLAGISYTLGTQTISLAPGAGGSLGFTFDLPRSPPNGFSFSGPHLVRATIDPGNTLVESVESDNEFERSWSFSRANVRNESLAGTGTITWGTTNTVLGALANVGQRPTPAGVRVRLYASLDPTINTSDVYLGETFLTPLAPGERRSYSITFNGARPASIPVGANLHIGVVVDPFNFIPETSESDNANRGVGIDRIAVRATN